MSIDYGHGLTNIDTKTGIRFGVISQNSILQAWCDSSEPDYGEATCPKCGNEATTAADAPDFDDDWTLAEHECTDYACTHCKYAFGSESAFGEEPICHSFEGDGYKMETCLDTDVSVLESPFYTYAPFCSPCVPGAGNLDDAARVARFTDLDYEQDLVEQFEHLRTMPRAYAVGHDWFDPPIAPYPLYGVVSGRPCFPDRWYGDGNDGPWTVVDGDRCQRGCWYLLSEAQTYLFAAHEGINMQGAFVRRIDLDAERRAMEQA
jgi:hypothetical protein